MQTFSCQIQTETAHIINEAKVLAKKLEEPMRIKDEANKALKKHFSYELSKLKKKAKRRNI